MREGASALAQNTICADGLSGYMTIWSMHWRSMGGVIWLKRTAKLLA